MILLAVDTSIGPCSVALMRDGKQLAYLREEQAGQQSERLMPMIEEALNQASLRYADLTHIACTIGPGGFTGIRTGLAAARGLALVYKIPLLGFTTFETIAWTHRDSTQPILVALNAYRGEAYMQLFTAGLTPAGEAQSIPYGQLAARKMETPLLFLTNLPDDFTAQFAVAARHHAIPDASALAELAHFTLTEGRQALPPEPFYIRAPDAKLPTA